jgi:hypothetical protein
VPPISGTWTSTAAVAAVACSNGWTISSVSLWPFPAIEIVLFLHPTTFVGAIYFLEVLSLNSFIEGRGMNNLQRVFVWNQLETAQVIPETQEHL